MPERGIGSVRIVEGCRTCDQGVDEGDGLGCLVFLTSKKDTDFCILYKDAPAALHYYRIVPRKGINFNHRAREQEVDCHQRRITQY